MTMAARFRQLLKKDGMVLSPLVFDPLGARIAERLGYELLGVGGYALGSHLCVTEPLMTMTEVVEASRRIVRAVNTPLFVDGDAGYGEPLHAMRTVREFEAAGIAGMFIEDQVYPKRVSYHKAVEHIIPLDEFLTKLKAAFRARQDPDFVIMARTDAMRTDGYAEGVRRANLCLEAGADGVLVFPNTVDEAKRAPKDIKGPIMYTNSMANSFGRPYLTVQEGEEMGYKVMAYAIDLVCAVSKAIGDSLRTLKEKGHPGFNWDEMRAVRQETERLIGLEEYYKIEEETVEKA